MNKVFAIFATCCALIGASQAYAASLVDLQVISRSTGQRLPLYQHRGKAYVVGAPGERYSLQLRNLTGARVLAVVSVDGVNAISGETAAPNQTGYVLGPYQVTDIAGWRKTTDEVARFYFTPLPDSYAARTDRPDNVGVIGLAVFREYVEPPPIAYAPQAFDSRIAGAARPAAPAVNGVMREERAQDKLGTGHGEREYSSVTHTEFRRASSSPAETVAIWYDSRERLASAGILPRNPSCCYGPQPFPGHFVPDPGELSFRTHE